ncbi:MAG TPA: hypothetical protein VFC19_52250, partial [Candidatus Limnocylindrales bacterium]|nr:hypothetical protein [Candidatus Limnocylindrales bacterium]
MRSHLSVARPSIETLTCAAGLWCADFARWVWRNANIKTGGLTAASGSFYTYGSNNGTLHTST